MDERNGQAGDKRKADDDEKIASKRVKADVAPSADAESLFANGVTVIDCSAQGPYVNDFDAALHGMPEYLDKDLSKIGYVMGGFAGLGNPSSFHNPFVRKVRALLAIRASSLFQSYAILASLPRGIRMEQLMDRTLYRPPNKVPTAEAWHRDQSPVDDDDLVFGGWLNCDPVGSQPQSFSCVFGTHKTAGTGVHKDARGEQGFVKIDEEERKKQKYRSRATTVSVPPGHWIVFHQNIVHEVVAIARAAPQRRVFAGWRLTTSDQPLFGEEELYKVCTQQGVPRLPSGQKVPMYASLHWTYERNRKMLLDWCQQAIKPNLLVTKELHEKQLSVVPRYMSSLKELGLAMYPAYSEHEMALLRPTPL
jgi:hypothetical protein